MAAKKFTAVKSRDSLPPGEKTAKKSKCKTEKLTLSSEEKLNVINEKINAIYEFCQSSGMTETEIEKSAQPLLKLVYAAKRKQHVGKLLKVMFVASVIGFVFYYDPAYRQLCIAWKLATMQLLPYWDWTAIYYSDCLIDNPYFENQRKSSMTDEDCEVCKQLSEIERAQGVVVEDAADLLMDNVPLVVTDAMIDWWAVTHNIDTNKIKQLYRNNGLTSHSDVCSFIDDNNQGEETSWEAFLNSTQGGWNIRWMNCARKSVRLVRNMYKRPYFVPPMVEMEKHNWVVTTLREPSAYQKFSLHSPMNLFSQVKGQYSVRLTPSGVCLDVCPPLSHTLMPGEILMFTDQWSLEYKPAVSTETLAFVTGGFWGPN